MEVAVPPETSPDGPPHPAHTSGCLCGLQGAVPAVESLLPRLVLSTVQLVHGVGVREEAARGRCGWKAVQGRS